MTPIKTPLDSIALVPLPALRFFLMDLVVRIKEKHGSVIHLYCKTEQERDFYRKQDGDGIYSSINIGSMPHRRTNDSNDDAEQIFRRAREYEERIGTTYNTLALADRHWGRGYFLGAAYQPRSHISENTSYLQMVERYNREFAFWDDEIGQKKFNLILGGNKIVARAAHANSIAYRNIAGARFKNLQFWTPNEFFENPWIEQAFNAAKADTAGTVIEEPYLADRKLRQRVGRSTSFVSAVRRSMKLALRHVYWNVRRYEKRAGYYLYDQVRVEFNRWRMLRRLSGPRVQTLDSLGNEQFVYFPLHTEPESSVSQFSPEYFYQQAAIAALSRDLPVGVKLVVKENVYSVGRRPSHFYDQIMALKNVIMLDYREVGLEVVRRSTAVATITGTAGFEAAVLGKPVLSFGLHNIYNVLPHVWVVRDEAKISAFFAEALGGEFDSDRAKSDGGRYLAAVNETSFDMGEYDFIDLHGYNAKNVDDAYVALLESLAPSRRTLKNA